jgi:hypothetical protein
VLAFLLELAAKVGTFTFVVVEIVAMAITFTLQRVYEVGSAIGLAGAVSTSGAMVGGVGMSGAVFMSGAIAGAFAMAATYKA